MLNIKKYVISDPQVVNDSVPAQKVIELLHTAPGAVICTADKSVLNGIISPFSLVKALKRSKPLEEMTAKDLVAKPVPQIKEGSKWSVVYDNLLKSGAALFKDVKGNTIGVITLSSLYDYLIENVNTLERELSAVINFSSDEILLADGEGVILRANSQFEEHFGIKLSSVIGKTVEELEARKIFFPSVTKLVLNSQSTQTVIQSRRDGRKLLATGTPAFNEDGSIFRVIVNTRDITKLNKLKQQLEETELLKNRYRQELVELRQGYLEKTLIVASSPAMTELIKVAEKIAAVDSTVMLTGESGVGKGMIARYIHNCSPRRDKPFTVVNCGAIPENLLESELFGYAGGAFTGARREGKIGKLELANEGTLFLDEITELPLILQVKLLHVLQEGVVNPIGGSREIKLNLRFIAASNRDIAKLVEEGEFREDLFFRLDVIPLEVPPLRERREDIRPLVDQILEKLNVRYSQQKYFSEEAFGYLEQYRWPGNVRELENMIERTVIVADHDQIGSEYLPPHITGDTRPVLARHPGQNIELQPLKKAREALEFELFSEALRTCKTTYEIAKALQVDQSTVVRKLQKYNLTRDGMK